ncbi:SNF2-related [Syntrophomonas zehnderi OL-4]|uniref:SNF2-related n=1 Tax=Syntrophomonas zehnderi OL-4 TaxID=690567 RepID=A0A0E4C8B3_9FIRM|nr:DEAD/DEAH box helicase [Syntrophomonas zehnderi]CFX06421.1 SNF2-related [Syntrophomonas zehnderi OL-4]CFX33296.1 SNF2-related [Syntrophomonas zehnderi OL-4]
MKIGDQVRCQAAAEKGLGVIVGQQKLFQHNYVEVFFAGRGETISFPANELLTVQSPEEMVRQQQFSPARRFLLRLFNQQLQASYTSDGLQTAANFKILPLPHQLLAVKYVLNQPSPRVLIADEVGLGKTIEAALIYEELKARGMVERVLIVAPSGLCLQWQEELRQKFDEDFAIYDRETVQTLKQLHGQSTNIWRLKDRIITSLDFIKPKKMNEEIQETALRRRGWHNEHVSEAAAQAGFDLVIFDEAHKLTKDMSGEETARFKAGKVLAETAPCFLLLSATPHQGDSVRFRYLLSLIDPHRFYRGCDLNPENVKAITVRNNKRAVVDFQGQRLFKQRITSLCKISRDKAEDAIELQLYAAVSEYVSKFYNLARQEQNQTMVSGKHWKNVIFHQSQALEKEECDLLGPGHPYMMTVSAKAAQELTMDISARMQVEEGKFAGETGVLFIYKLKLNNYVDRERLFIIPCFISAAGQYHSRISKYFQEMPERVRDLIKIEPGLDWDLLMEKGQNNAERLAESIYYEETLNLEDKIRKQEESRQAYFQAREQALLRIAVDNIRNARLNELQEEMRRFQLQSRRRRQLIPSLNCEQIAYVEFV